MTGSLYVIGVGPGDPELLTVKAVNVLKGVPVICVPKGREDGSSLALSIVSGLVDLQGKEIMDAHFPMVKTRSQQSAVNGQEMKRTSVNDLDAKWNQTAQTILEKLKENKSVAFLTLGDPTIYSTFYYLYDKLKRNIPDLDVRVIPGISSINASAAAAGLSLSLANEKIAILPATYENSVRSILEKFDTVVLMKVHRVFDKVRDILEDMNLIDNTIYICRAGMKDEKIFRDIRGVGEDDLNYFSVLIVKK